MPAWVRARPNYRHDPLEGNVWDEEGDGEEDSSTPTIDVKSRVVIPAKARHVNWERILRHVEPRMKLRAREQILRKFLDLFIDGDHKVKSGGDGHLYFWASPAEEALTVALTHVDRDGKQAFSKLSMLQRREAVRPGYSLVSFAQRDDVGTHAVFERAVTSGKEDGGVVHLANPALEQPCWMKTEKWQKEEGSNGPPTVVMVMDDDSD